MVDIARKQKIKKIMSLILKNELLKKRTLVLMNNILSVIDNIKNGKYKKSDLFDYKATLTKHYFFCGEYYRANSLYGIAPSLKRYSGYNKSIKACIEHGVFFGKTQIPIETFESGLPAVIYFSHNRKQYLRPITQQPLIAIGPYIHYAEPYLSEQEFEKYRRKFGKTLLAFPIHSAEGIKSEYDANELCEEIDRIKSQQGFKTVMVCLYYRDIEMGRDKYYQDRGYIVVCSGRREDPLFLSRQKSFIQLADYTVSNAVGTHIGYCVLLGKPHMIIDQITKYNSDNAIAATQIAEQDIVAINNKAEVKAVFQNWTSEITNDQLEIVDKYWGISKVKSPSELNQLLSMCDEVFSKAKHNKKLFVQKAEVIFGKNSEEMM
jgi:hypothetical protein